VFHKTTSELQDQDRFFWSQTGLVLRPTVSDHITGLRSPSAFVSIRYVLTRGKSHSSQPACSGIVTNITYFIRCVESEDAHEISSDRPIGHGPHVARIMCIVCVHFMSIKHPCFTTWSRQPPT